MNIDLTVILLTSLIEIALYCKMKANFAISEKNQRIAHLKSCRQRQAEEKALGLEPTLWDMGSQKRRNGF